jgi:DNA helicase II / ATP-dependent DNA helicase PcrA
MSEEQPTLESALSDRQRAVEHDRGPLLVTGAPGTGKTELLARRLAHLVGSPLHSELRPENVLMIASSRTTAARLRARCEALLTGSFEELWIGSWDAIGERLLREYSEEAGLDPFFDVLGRAERLAMLLDRLDRLPLRRHEIRGNPAGLLARLLARIDNLKAERVGPTTLSERAAAATPEDEAGREAIRREQEFAELYVTHDRILAETGSLDRGDVFLALDCLLVERPDVRRQISERWRYLMVDELEEATPAQLAVVQSLAADKPTTRTSSSQASAARRLRARRMARSGLSGSPGSSPTASGSSWRSASAIPS